MQSMLLLHVQERFSEVQAELQPFLQHCGFRASMLQWLPASAPLGQNLVHAPTEAALAAWWRGPTLAEAIDQLPVGVPALGRPLRMPVTEVGKASRGAVSTSGKLEAGALQVSQALPHPCHLIPQLPRLVQAGHRSVQGWSQHGQADDCTAGISSDVTKLHQGDMQPR